jgi:hypothetical protein
MHFKYCECKFNFIKFCILRDTFLSEKLGECPFCVIVKIFEIGGNVMRITALGAIFYPYTVETSKRIRLGGIYVKSKIAGYKKRY